ncbi:11713_t:CDS:2, partial [Entrophospora sp. SA101]
ILINTLIKKLNNELNDALNIRIDDVLVGLINLIELLEVLEAISNCIDCKRKLLDNNEISTLLNILINTLTRKLNSELNDALNIRIDNILVGLINLIELLEILETISNCIDCKKKLLNNNEIKTLLSKLIEVSENTLNSLETDCALTNNDFTLYIYHKTIRVVGKIGVKYDNWPLKVKAEVGMLID